GLGNDGALGVRCDVHHLGAGVLVLALACKCDGQGFTLGVLAYQVNGRVLHGHLGADVAIDPFHGGALFADGTLGDEVVHVVGPVLDGRVADAGALLHDDLHNGGVQRVRGVDRSRATFDVVNVGVLIGDDQGALELAHVLRVDTEVSLERDVDVHALGHVHERSTGPYCRVQGGELVVAHGDDGAEVLLEDLRVFPQGGVRVQEDNALGFEVLADLVVDNFGFVLGRDAGNEPAALSFRDAELFVGVPDVFGQVFPRCRLLLSGTHEVLDVVEVDAREVCAPRRHGLTVEVLQALEAQIEHPFGLVLLRGDVADNLLVEATTGVCAYVVLVGPAVLVVSDTVQFGILLQNLRDHSAVSYRFLCWLFRHDGLSCWLFYSWYGLPDCSAVVCGTVAAGRQVGMWVVQTCPPCAR